MATATTAPSTRIRRPLALAGGLLALAVVSVPFEQSSAAFTSRSVNPAAGITAAPDWTPPTVGLAVAPALRNGATVTATASDGETGVRQVVISWAPTGTQTWAPICTRTAAPYACTINTAGMPAEIDLRAVATDGAGYAATAFAPQIDIDNGAPTAAITGVTNTSSGVLTVGVTADDLETDVAQVVVQHRPANTATWLPLCTDDTRPFSCRWDTTVLVDGNHELRAQATDLAGNVSAWAAVTTRVDNTKATVSVDQPPSFLRGTETITANAYSGVGVASVRLEWSRTNTNGSWVALCTDSTAPYSCGLATVGMADGNIWFRAILTDTKGATTTSAPVGPVLIDNSPTRGHDVQATNGGTAGRVDAGDAISLTYNRRMNLGTIAAGWDGSPRAVTLRLRDGALLGLGGSDDTLDVLVAGSNLNNPTLVHLGSVNLRTDQVKPRTTVSFAGTIVRTETTVNGLPVSVITITVGAQLSGTPQQLRTSSASPTMAWSPSATARDEDGIATSPSPVNELGPQDRDL